MSGILRPLAGGLTSLRTEGLGGRSLGIRYFRGHRPTDTFLESDNDATQATLYQAQTTVPCKDLE